MTTVKKQFNPDKAQRLMHEHLTTRKEGALFAGMGLGKTAATLWALYDMMADGAIRGVLIVAPLRVCNIQWPAEVAKWEQFKDLEIANLRTKEGQQALLDGSAHLYVINYEMLKWFREWYLLGRRKLAFDTVVWDEISMAKDHNGKRINSVRQYFRKHCTRHYGLTGTPQPNSLLDLFAQVRLLDGGKRLGRSYNHFRDTYFVPIDYEEHTWVAKKGAKDKVYRAIGDLALVLKSSDWSKAPDIFVEDVPVVLKDEGKAYKAMEQDLLVEVGDEVIFAQNAAVLVGKLQQLTTGALYTSETTYEVFGDAKLKTTLKLLKSISGPVIIMTMFRHERERLLKALPDAISFQTATTPKKQKALCEDWNEGKVKHLIVDPRSMSHGLNLQNGGSDIVMMSLDWSRERYDQIIARLARRGQDEITNVYQVIAKGSIDDGILHALHTKSEDQNQLLDALKEYYALRTKKV